MKANHALIAISVIFIVVTLFLAGLSLRITDMAIRVQTMYYATYTFISGIAILILAEIVHIIKKGMSRNID